MTAKPYRPSNGTEGVFFYQRWCERCQRTEEWLQGGHAPCDIFNRTLAFKVGDPEYPSEWVQTADVPFEQCNPRCTAFEPLENGGTVFDIRQESLSV